MKINVMIFAVLSMIYPFVIKDIGVYLSITFAIFALICLIDDKFEDKP